MNPGIAAAFDLAHAAILAIQQARAENRDVSADELRSMSLGLQVKIDAFQAKLDAGA